MPYSSNRVDIMRLSPRKGRMNEIAASEAMGDVGNGDPSQSNNADMIPNRGRTILLLSFFMLFHVQFNKRRASSSLFDEIPRTKPRMGVIQSAATNWLSMDSMMKAKPLAMRETNSGFSEPTLPPETRIPALVAPTIPSTDAQPKRTKKQRSTSPYQNEHKKVVTVVAQLNGELGNQMHKIANAVCVQRHIERKLQLPTELKLRAQDNAKWERSMKNMKEAFPSTRPLNFRAGNTPLFDQVRQIQEDWIQSLVANKKVNLTGIGDPKVMNRMKSSGWQPTQEILRLLNQTWYMDRPMAPGGNTEFSIPHIYSDAFTSRYCFEKMLTEIRDFFAIDEYRICKQKPQPDESVLHLRNFLVEMGKAGRDLGFEELSPEKTATEIFANYTPGDKVAIVSRFQTNTDKYIKALKEIRGIDARYIKGQTGNQDFCFLLKSRKDIIGQRVSTFATWAGLLGRPERLRLYSVDSKYTRAKKRSFYKAKWDHPELKKVIVYENYKA
ncbi:unnamed protein product [Cylindrotheca closterium]|uniref:Uncharacterized protein n=1 Tax=Cylindrotheca closterium TaxID=2856 RepID=A0AAD2FQ95_9STRA|nr:unnamed protein product [Cylindrotheca closterium]